MNIRLLFILGFIASIAMVIVGSWGTYNSFAGQPFTLVNQEVNIPLYWTAECVQRPEHMQEKQITSHTDDPTFYQCTTEGTGTYIPLGGSQQCEYTFDEFAYLEVWKCDGAIANTQQNLDNFESLCDSATKTIEVGLGQTATITIPAGDSIHANTDVFGTALLYAKYPSYGLRVRNADNFVAPTTLSCFANSIPGNIENQIHTLDLQDRLEIVPGVPLNAVSARIDVSQTNQLVTLSDVENNNIIYITRPGHYQKVKTAEDGFLYVDTKTEYSDADIECIPRTAGCSDDAKIIPLEDQQCDGLGTGSLTGYAPVQGDSTQLCKYQCGSDGTLSKTNQCIEVRSEPCPDDKPLWDTATGQCVELQTNPPNENNNETDDYLFIAVLLLGMAGVVYTRKPATGKKRGKK